MSRAEEGLWRVNAIRKSWSRGVNDVCTQFVFIWGLEIAGVTYDLGAIPFGDLLVATVALVMGWLIARFPTGPLETSMRRFDRVFSALRPVTEPASK